VAGGRLPREAEWPALTRAFPLESSALDWGAYDISGEWLDGERVADGGLLRPYKHPGYSPEELETFWTRPDETPPGVATFEEFRYVRDSWTRRTER
jgi:hypothetical protein